MKLSTQIIQAEDLPVDVFIYLPDENRFFFIDDIDIIGDEVWIFSEFLTESGIDPEILVVEFDTTFRVVNNYNVNNDNLFK